jgi:Fe-S cluster assembly iron-binding protein IscA
LLTITPRAWRALDDLTQQQHGTGVRLARTDTGALSLDVTAGPEHDDTVVWSRGPVVYIDRHAAPAVDHAVLDLRTSPESNAFFLR